MTAPTLTRSCFSLAMLFHTSMLSVAQQPSGMQLPTTLSQKLFRPPKLRLTEVEQVAPTRYHVELTLDPMKDTFSGAIIITLSVNSPVHLLWLNAHNITVQDEWITAGG